MSLFQVLIFYLKENQICLILMLLLNFLTKHKVNLMVYYSCKIKVKELKIKIFYQLKKNRLFHMLLNVQKKNYLTNNCL